MADAAAEATVAAREGKPQAEQKPDQSGAGGSRPAGGSGDGIGGISTLRGVLVYAAVLAFAGLYIDFIILISRAKPPGVANIDPTRITAAAALAGVLGSAFALRVGNPASQTFTNTNLATKLNNTTGKRPWKPDRAKALINRALSLEASGADAKSWPVTFGMWVYALVGSGVAITYVLNEQETPGGVKALAVTFAGYVIVLLSHVFGSQSSPSAGATNPAPNQPPAK